jgi:hypothetical protein
MFSAVDRLCRNVSCPRPRDKTNVVAPSFPRPLRKGWQTQNHSIRAPSIRRSLSNGWEGTDPNPPILHSAQVPGAPGAAFERQREMGTWESTDLTPSGLRPGGADFSSPHESPCPILLSGAQRSRRTRFLIPVSNGWETTELHPPQSGVPRPSFAWAGSSEKQPDSAFA